MVVEVLLVALVLVVASLMAWDLARTPSEIPLGQADGQAHDGERDFIRAPGSIGAGEFGRETAGSGMTTAAPDADPLRQRPDDVSSSATARQRPGTGPAPDTGPRRALKNWPVRSRLLLLVVTPTLTTLIFGIVLITSSLRSASSHSSNGAVRAGAIVSALVDGAVVIIVVLLALLVTSLWPGPWWSRCADCRTGLSR